jgi:hypothetical protein
MVLLLLKMTINRLKLSLIARNHVNQALVPVTTCTGGSGIHTRVCELKIMK